MSACRRLSSFGRFVFCLSLWALLSPAAQADNTLWSTVHLAGVDYDVHVVSTAPLGSGFPGRELQHGADSAAVRDIYVVNAGTGQVTDLVTARILVSVAQSAFKNPAVSSAPLNPEAGVPAAEAEQVSAPYPLWTSAFFSSSFVDGFIRQGLPDGLDDPDRRTQVYRELLVDVALQPELADSPPREEFFQAFLDSLSEDQGFADALAGAIDQFRGASDLDTMDWDLYEQSIEYLSTDRDGLVDLTSPSPGSPSPIDRLFGVLDQIPNVQRISGAAARAVLIETLANERALLRMRLVGDFVARAETQPGFDPALQNGFDLAQADIEAYVNEYYRTMASVFVDAVAEDSGGALRLRKRAKKLVRKLFGRTAARTFARTALPWALSYEVYKLIRDQEDRARNASLALTLQRLIYESYGLAHHRDRMHLASGPDAVEAQAFLELLQVSWYLSARHYQDALLTLNNRLSRFYGAGLDIFAGASYGAQMEELSRQLEHRRLIAMRLVPPVYLSAVQDTFESTPKIAEYPWIMSLVRDLVAQDPSQLPEPLLGICLTLPFNPSGTPATLQGMNIRFEPRGCGDPQLTQPWECSANDPDGDCRARVQLFWDDDTNPANADCANGSGPCPIGGAQDLSPERGLFFWDAEKDGVMNGEYYLYARIAAGEHSVATYSQGPYDFIDPLYSAGAWDVIAREIHEGVPSDGDGIPELGEVIEIRLTLQNTSGRPLENIKIHSLKLEGEGVRNVVLEDWDPTRPDDLALSHIVDGDVLLSDAAPGEIVAASDDFDIYVGNESSTDLAMVAWVEYADPDNPVGPQYRRIEEIGFSTPISDGTGTPLLRCDHIDLVGDTDGDGIFESGERGSFTATLCNDGSWEAQAIRGIFDEPAAIGEWRDNDAPFPNLSPGECQESDDDYALRVGRDECAGAFLPMTVEFNGSQSQPFVTCPISIFCAPYQSIQDEQDAGTVAPGEPIVASISISNPGSSGLTIGPVSEVDGLADTTIDSFPATLASGAFGSIEVTIDTTTLAPGRYLRTIQAESNANNLDERESVITFGVTGGGAAEQITTNGIGNNAADVSGNVAVYERGNDIYAIDLTTRVELQVTATPDREYDPRISGNRIVFTRDQGVTDVADIYLYDLATGEQIQLTDHPGKQSDPDIHGDTVIWADGRPGPTNDDIYKYVVDSSSINGELFIDLETPGRAADEPRIDEAYVAYIVREHDVPGNPGTFARDFGYFDRAASTLHLAGVSDGSPCKSGNRFDLSGHHLAFECDCGLDCDRDDMIYYINMDARSAPVRLTCDLGLGDDREEPFVQGDEVLYALGGDDDIYKVAIGPTCQTEVPLQVGPQVSRDPAGDPNGEAYVFRDNRTGPFQLWGVLPTPPIDAAVTSFYFDATEFFQEGSYDFHVLIRNDGEDLLVDLPVTITDNGWTVHQETLPNLPAGGSVMIDATWSTAGSAEGLHELRAFLDPPPPGDGNSANDERTLSLDILDDDETPPVISSPTVEPGPSHDGDPYLEEGEDVTISWTATDPKGVAETVVTLGGTSSVGVPLEGDRYSAQLANPGVGQHAAEITATDADDSPATTEPPLIVPLEVFPAFPEVIGMTPEDGATEVDPRAAIEAVFSVEMDPASFNPPSFLLRQPGGSPVAAAITYDSASRTARLEPDPTLNSLTTYEATVLGGSGGLRDIRQNELPSTISWSFTTADTIAPHVLTVASTPDTGDGVLAEGEVTAVLLTSLGVAFNESMSDPPGDAEPGDVTNPVGYLLFGDGADGFDTVDCASGVSPGDVAVALDPPVYDPVSQTVALSLAGGEALAEGAYRLLVCSTLQDEAGNELDGDGDGTGGDDFPRSFVIDRTAPTNPSAASPSHSPGVWSQLTQIAVEWSGASDEIGLDGYSILFDQDSGSLPDEVVDVPQGADPHAALSQVLPDGSAFFFHLRACDVAGNCTSAVHLGPFQIDTTAPSPPIDPASPSHPVGTPTALNVVEVAWQAAVDTTSGIDGYSIEFSDQETGSCDQLQDVEETVLVAFSDLLTEGSWWAHFCSVDRAGLWSGIATAGPFVVDLTSPGVLGVSSTADTGDGQLLEAETTDAPITQLSMTFSEEVLDVAADDDPDDVTNPDNYLLYLTGPDGDFDTIDCLAGVDPQDQEISVDIVTYDAAASRATVRVNGLRALPQGAYQLRICGSTSILDVAGNPLDGNGDGQGGDDFVLGFEVLATHLPLNPNFDSDLSSWDVATPPEGVIAHRQQDVDGIGTSGSAEVLNLAGLGADYGLSQCVPVQENRVYRAGISLRIGSDQTTDPQATVDLEFFDSPGCAGNLISAVSPGLFAGDTEGLWVDALFGSAASPTRAASARVRYRLLAGLSADFDADLDRVFFLELTRELFSDGFESGDTSAWSGTVP